MQTPDLPEISKPLHVFAICFWAVTLAYIPLSLLGELIDLSTVFALATVIEMFWSGAYRRDFAASTRKGGSDLFGRIVAVSCTITLALFLVAFIAIFPGTPEIVEGAYVRTSHGDVVAPLTQQEYQLLTLCERMMQPLVFLGFSSGLLNGIHTRYRMQNAK